ncbi:tryptophan--tRNA ligase [Verticiella sediminum]|uniref:Tryptophan--tRNA ligase n=1 Tax=Verticiella sediminum TaxID=1247510 RepID=A0A556ACK7_9BURK|nr:tryptophan--tRNA ligase [Verticiella sediminum]TSH90619.1 tryptophan--tRNA ligase [Verticiella sediminum]
MTTRVLTGITTTGTPHLGNYVGALRPAIAASRQAGVDAFYFLADYHALIKCEDPERIERSRREIAATWLAAGLDPEQVTFYRQSDIPEVAELCWVLNCVTAKGLMNRAHAYKAAVDQNNAAGVEPDDGVTMGLFSYPVLMAADILIFNAHKVPVGRDQVQHLEMARDIAQRFNHMYGKGRAIFTLPEAVVDEEGAVLPGLDGRKMSKSYNNTVPLFEGGAKGLREAIARIVTDSRAPGEPKDAESSHLYPIFRAFATPEQDQAFRAALADGMSWGDAKKTVVDCIEAVVGPMRARYEELMAAPVRVEEILQLGAEKARKLAEPLMDEVRQAVGLRAAKAAVAGVPAAAAKKAGGKLARFVSFREKDGTFRFRLLAGDGETLIVSDGFVDPKAAGAAIRAIQDGTAQLRALPDGYAIELEGQRVAAREDLPQALERAQAMARYEAEIAALREAQ